LLRELAGRASLWVRAVDGVSFDVRRGEVYCLVGESGCGKTTTGKSLVGLVDATEGDVFLEMPDASYDQYESLLARPHDAATLGAIDRLRRKYSFTWKESLRWALSQYAILAGMIGAGFFGSLFPIAVVAAYKTNALLDPWATVGLSVAMGVLFGGTAALPPTRPDRRTASAAAVLAAVGFNILPMLASWLAPLIQAGAPGFDPYGAWASAWGGNTFGMLIGQIFAPAAAGGVARVVIGFRQERGGLRGIKMRTLRRRLHLIFQDPYESLNPKQSVLEIVEEPLRVNHISSDPGEITALVRGALEDAGLRPAEEFLFRFPHELSGGQRQRVSIAAALVLRPDFIVADEPVSMLDVSIRTEILQLMLQLREKRDLTYLFITHDLGLAWILADRVAVMYLGKIVEEGTAEQVIAHPKHPYTQALISVVPSPDPRKKVERVILKGERPDPVDIPTGCRFHPRCPLAFEKCGWTAQEVADELKSLAGGGLLPGTVAIAVVPGTVPDATVDTLRRVVKDHREARLPLKGISEVRATGNAVNVTLHTWSEPQLVELEPGNAVACHLVTPPSEAPQAVTA
jgi:oligopeptide/dipeptide ABC transporter ATP-binding protein